MTVNKDWHLEAIKLHKDGLSSRKIAAKLGKGKSSVNDLLVKWYKTQPENEKIKEDKPYILFIDIETFALKFTGFGMYNQNFSIDQIAEDWSILSFCAKRSDSDEIIYMAADEYTEIEMLEKMWQLLDEAPYVCGHNSQKFDVPRIFARMLNNGMSRPRPFRQIDTLKISRRIFGQTSNKLAYLTEKLCKEHVKMDHGKFAGIQLWLECAKGNPEAFEELRLYNVKDVLSLEELHGVLAQWDDKYPVLEVHCDEVVDMSDWEHCGFVYSNLAKYDCYRNEKTKQYRRGRVNLLSKDKRNSLLSNI